MTSAFLPPFVSLTAAKVPHITALFWTIKVLTTGMGETTSDFLVTHIDPVFAVLGAGAILTLSLVVQFALRRYVPWVYWSTVAMVSVFGTMDADVAHIVLGVPYLVSTAVFAVALALVFTVWARVEGTLSIHSITTRRRESFYWLTVLCTFALGTAAGDLTATTIGLGYLGSGLLFVVVIVVPAIAYRWFGLGSIGTFWFAYVVTRPLGASFADWMGVPPSRGGLDWGTGPVSVVLATTIAILVAAISIRYRSSKVAGDSITRSFPDLPRR